MRFSKLLLLPVLLITSIVVLACGESSTKTNQTSNSPEPQATASSQKTPTVTLPTVQASATAVSRPKTENILDTAVLEHPF